MLESFKSVGTGTTFVRNGITFTNSGTIQVQNGTLSFGAGATQAAGQIVLEGGTITASLLNIQSGVLTGSGTVTGAVQNAGEVRPGGLGAGRLIVSGNYNQLANGILRIDLGGVTPESQYDQLVVGGIATIAGTLEVNLIGGFLPPNASSFDALTFGSRTGDFSVVNGLTLPNGLVLNRTFAATKMTLTAAQPLMANALPIANTSEVISQHDLESAYGDAVRDWVDSGLSHELVDKLKSVQLVISDLPDRTLATAVGLTIIVDRNAAGHGWFIDLTPDLNDEYSLKVNDNTLRAANGTSAGNGMDLLTVLLHEQAHILGHEHEDNEDTSLMFATLASGTRYLLDSLMVNGLAGTTVMESVSSNSAGRSSFAASLIDLSLSPRASSPLVATGPFAIHERNVAAPNSFGIPIRNDDLYKNAAGTLISDQRGTGRIEKSRFEVVTDSVDDFFEHLASEDFTKSVQEYDLMAKLRDRYFDCDY